jgi:pyruvate/2-oxoglutarate dehydrogenase complex dihydrolipoamide dehydrogenase (E3) component
VLHLSDGSSVSGSHLLVAVGRRPAADGLGLEAAGVQVDKGRVVTDENLQAAKTVWAAGRLHEPAAVHPRRRRAGRLAAKNAFARGPFAGKSWDDSVVPWVTFTEPEIAHVGLTEQQAVASTATTVRVSTVYDTHGDRARTAGETDGFVKLVAIPGKVGGMALGSLVGMTVVGPMAGEQIAEGALSMRAGTLSAGWRRRSTPIPTWSLSTRVAAARFFGEHGGEPAREGRA